MRKVLVIIQRANGDVYLSSPLINAIQSAFPEAQIDLLINDDTLQTAALLKHIKTIHLYCYSWRKRGRIYQIWQELKLAKRLWKKYDISICLTGSDRSVFYAIVAGRESISAVESDRRKSWWKRKLLSRAYLISHRKHMVQNNCKPLEFLGAKPRELKVEGHAKTSDVKAMRSLLKNRGIERFIIFHPTAQYHYKIYPEINRSELLRQLNSWGVDVIVTGADSEIDQEVSKTIPDLGHIHNFMGKTTLSECVALTSLSDAYIGVDTLNMHIAASFEIPIFAIFGPTNPVMWSPWSNAEQIMAIHTAPVQHYGNITLFQANLPCVACGLAGCENLGVRSECLKEISPHFILKYVSAYLD